ncbi:hypothetical protein CHU92_11930 [Flavobacterium cyanobacteriorum]|uniref:Uncharacterized protein n=2 Tax=Flavobacterium cyanobacteriorum TaxID=2022802 RepID=A0A255YYQ1_9FLAO|nr:hypothetical protein CHU92_11930 [Flavobacterium cyanobacteriorum]
MLFAQKDRVIYIDNLSSEALKYSFASNYTSASFYIYYIGYETKKKRDSIEQFQMKKREKLASLGTIVFFPAIPPTGTNFLATHPPEILSSLEGIVTITLKDYREHKFKNTNPRNTYIIVPHKETGKYLKWRVMEEASK